MPSSVRRVVETSSCGCYCIAFQFHGFNLHCTITHTHVLLLLLLIFLLHVLLVYHSPSAPNCTQMKQTQNETTVPSAVLLCAVGKLMPSAITHHMGAHDR